MTNSLPTLVHKYKYFKEEKKESLIRSILLTITIFFIGGLIFLGNKYGAIGKVRKTNYKF
jgi:hypothetical protein